MSDTSLPKILIDCDIFDLICLSPHEHYTEENIKRRIRQVSLLVHPDKTAVNSPGDVGDECSQTKLNALKEWLFTNNMFDLRWPILVRHGKQKWTSTWNCDAQGAARRHPIPSYRAHSSKAHERENRRSGGAEAKGEDAEAKNNEENQRGYEEQRSKAQQKTWKEGEKQWRNKEEYWRKRERGWKQTQDENEARSKAAIESRILEERRAARAAEIRIKEEARTEKAREDRQAAVAAAVDAEERRAESERRAEASQQLKVCMERVVEQAESKHKHIQNAIEEAERTRHAAVNAGKLALADSETSKRSHNELIHEVAKLKDLVDKCQKAITDAEERQTKAENEAKSASDRQCIAQVLADEAEEQATRARSKVKAEQDRAARLKKLNDDLTEHAESMLRIAEREKRRQAQRWVNWIRIRCIPTMAWVRAKYITAPKICFLSCGNRAPPLILMGVIVTLGAVLFSWGIYPLTLNKLAA